MVAIRILALILTLLGFLFTLTVIGAVIGVPMMVVGSIMMMTTFFRRQKTTITNVVNVGGMPYPGVTAPPAPATQPAIATNEDRRLLEQPSQGLPELSTASFCPGCGAAVVERGSAFCAHCGNRL